MRTRILNVKPAPLNTTLYQKFMTISIRFHRRSTRDNNEVLNALQLAKQFKLKHQMEQSVRPSENQRNIGRSVMLALPNTIKGRYIKFCYVTLL